MIRISLLLCMTCLLTFVKAQNKSLKEAEGLFDQSAFQETIDFIAGLEEKSSEHLVLQGRAYFELKDFDKAIETLESCVDLDSKSVECLYWLGASNIEALQADENFFKKGIYAFDALSSLQEAIELKPDHLKARTRFVNYYINAPLIAGGSINKAKEQAKAVMNYDSNLGNQLIASIYLKNEEYDQAEAIYLRTINENRATEKVYYLLSEICRERNDYPKAFQYLDSSLKHYPDYKMAHYQYAKLAVLTNQNIEQGIKHIKTYLIDDQDESLPGKHWAFLRLGQLLQTKEEQKAARQAFESSLNENADFKQAKEALKGLSD
ncbi:MAG: tetratricopeptide repeat protein [Vicingaceae bacterium]